MLRVFFSDPPGAEHVNSWVRFTQDGRIVARGHDVPARWPADTIVEAVVAARHVRLAALELPPMTRHRLAAAARYALEDQMATPADQSAIAVTSTGVRAVIAGIASRALIESIAARVPRIARIVPEPALAYTEGGWMWCASAGGGGFIRRDDGSAFAVAAPSDGELPVELTAALFQSGQSGTAPAVVRAAIPHSPTLLARWSQATGVAFVAAPEWRWENAPAQAFAAAPDFLAGESAAETTTRSMSWRRFRPALALGALAIVLHMGALLVQWASLALDEWRLSRAIVEQAGDAAPNAATPDAAIAALTRRNAELRHRAGQTVATDAVPLLARAAPALEMLPRGTLKRASYSNGTWTIELGTRDAASVSSVTRALDTAGVDAVSALVPTGTRMRLTLSPIAR